MATAYKTRNTKTDRKTPYDIITENIINMLKQGEIPWNQPWQKTRPVSVHGHAYRGMNYFLLNWVSRNYKDPRFITFNQAHKMGGHVKKGEHGYPVILWQWLDKEDKDTGKIKSIPYCRLFIVFNVEQTEDCKLPELKMESLDFVPSDKAEEIINNWTDKPTMQNGGSEAFYNWVLDTVQVPPTERFNSIEDYYSVLWHELGHATGHPNRLNRRNETELTEPIQKYGKEELVAQMFAAFLLSECCMDSQAMIENSAAYVQSWIKVFEDDPKMLIQAASQAQKAADYVLGRSYTTQEKEDEE